MSRLTSEGNIYRRLRLWRPAHRPEFSTLIPKQWTLKLHEPVENSSHETVEFLRHHGGLDHDDNWRDQHHHRRATFFSSPGNRLPC